MEEGTTAGEYRAKRRKYVELSQGDKFYIRKPGRKALTEMLGIFGITITKDSAADELLEDEVRQRIEDNLTQEQLARFINLILTGCVVRPKVKFQETEAEGELWIEDIDPEDIMLIFRAVLEFLGIDPETLDELSFRGERDAGSDSGSSGGDLRPETESSIEGY